MFGTVSGVERFGQSRIRNRIKKKYLRAGTNPTEKLNIQFRVYFSLLVKQQKMYSINMECLCILGGKTETLSFFDNILFYFVHMEYADDNF